MTRFGHSRRSSRRQLGTTAVEFAIVSAVFFMLLIGVLEMGRMLFYWNSAAEATRLGARLAVVCDLSDPEIKTRMIEMWPQLTNATIQIDYLDPPNAVNTCTVSTCKRVNVKIVSFNQTPVIPFINLTLAVPSFSTTLPRESMSSANNAVCS
jgi:Flp pilus assembly protein TadG